MSSQAAIEKLYEKIQLAAKETRNNSELLQILAHSGEFENINHVLVLLNALVHIKYFYLKQLIIENNRKKLSRKQLAYIKSYSAKSAPLKSTTLIFKSLLSIKRLCS